MRKIRLIHSSLCFIVQWESYKNISVCFMEFSEKYRIHYRLVKRIIIIQFYPTKLSIDVSLVFYVIVHFWRLIQLYRSFLSVEIIETKKNWMTNNRELLKRISDFDVNICRDYYRLFLVVDDILLSYIRSSCYRFHVNSVLVEYISSQNYWFGDIDFAIIIVFFCFNAWVSSSLKSKTLFLFGGICFFRLWMAIE